MKDLSHIKRVSFDVWGTLLKSNPAFHPARVQLFVDSINSESLFGELYVTYEAAEEIIKSNIAAVDLAQKTLGKSVPIELTYYNILHDFHISHDKITIEKIRELQRRIEAVFFELPPILLVEPEKIKELQTIVPSTVITSNTQFITGETIKRVLDDYYDLKFDDYFFSDEQTFCKPSLNFYQEVRTFPLQRWGSFIKTLHIGDCKDLDGIASIYNIGIETAIIGGHGTVDDFKSLDDIPQLIDALKQKTIQGQ